MKKDTKISAKPKIKDKKLATEALILYMGGYDFHEVAAYTQCDFDAIQIWVSNEFPENWEEARKRREKEVKSKTKQKPLEPEEYAYQYQQICLSMIKHLHNRVTNAQKINPAIALKYIIEIGHEGMEAGIDPLVHLQSRTKNPNVNILAVNGQANGAAQIIDHEQPSNFMDTLKGEWQKQQVKNAALPAKT